MKKEKNYEVKWYAFDYERERMEMNARRHKKILSAYIRESTSNFCVMDYNYDLLSDHNDMIAYLSNSLNNIFLFMRRRRDYTSVGLQLASNTRKEIFELEKEFINIMSDDMEKKRKVVSKETKKIVVRYLEKKERTEIKNGK